MEPEDQVTTAQIVELLEAGDQEGALVLLGSLHAADQADIIADLPPETRAPLLPLLPLDTLAAILGHLREGPRRKVVDELRPMGLGPILDQVDGDVVADILRDMPDEEQVRILSTMVNGPQVTGLLEHADESAGGRMTADLIALQKGWTADQAIEYLRSIRPDVEQAYYLYVVDVGRRLEGVVSLRHLITAAPDTRVDEIMEPDVIGVTAGTDQEEAARLLRRYDLIALPVVDEENRLVGVISADDLMEVEVEEATEDMYRMVGLAESASLLRPLRASLAPRLGWLLVNLLTAFLAAITVNAFESTIAKVAAVAVFMPVIAGMGGNAGVQSTTLVVRALALGELQKVSLSRLLRREWAQGLLNGVVIGLMVGVAAFIWKDNVTLGVVAGLAMFLNLLIAATAGVLVPLGLRAARSDPAMASGIILTAITDILGFFFLLGLAALLVERLT